jgi:hypothetical protein
MITTKYSCRIKAAMPDNRSYLGAMRLLPFAAAVVRG